jgi:malate dehydrogenase (oxaloacetate-decarboxylating)(NADP+)
MDEFMDEFMDAMKEVFPNLLVQFEDFSTDNAFKYLDRFREKYRCFNDDVSFSGQSRLDPMLTKACVDRSKAQARSCCRVS